LQSLLDRRHVALPALATVVNRVRCRTARQAAATVLERGRELCERSPHATALLNDGPDGSSEFQWLKSDLQDLANIEPGETGRVQQLQRRPSKKFLRATCAPRAQ